MFYSKNINKTQSIAVAAGNKVAAQLPLYPILRLRSVAEVAERPAVGFSVGHPGQLITVVKVVINVDVVDPFSYMIQNIRKL